MDAEELSSVVGKGTGRGGCRQAAQRRRSAARGARRKAALVRPAQGSSWTLSQLRLPSKTGRRRVGGMALFPLCQRAPCGECACPPPLTSCLAALLSCCRIFIIYLYTNVLLAACRKSYLSNTLPRASALKTARTVRRQRRVAPLTWLCRVDPMDAQHSKGKLHRSRMVARSY